MLIPQSKYFSGKLRIKHSVLGPATQININGVSITCSLSKKNFNHLPIKLIPKSVTFESNAVKLEEFVPDSGHLSDFNHINSEFGITINHDDGKMSRNFMLSKLYRCLYVKSEKKLKLTLFPSKKLCFNLHSVENSKFAKTQKLQKILTGQCPDDNSGIITMDQMGRILIESNQCQFPAVGFWLKCDSLNSPSVYFNIFAFLKKKPTKNFTKLLSTMDNQSCIYFAKLNQNQIPQLFLVSWTYQESQSEQKDIVQQYEVQQGKIVNLQFNQSHLQFTLRGQMPQGMKQLDFVSPKKQMTNQELEDELERLHLQESPQFSSIKKYEEKLSWEDQKTQMKMKIEAQQEQILTLKKQMERLYKQLAKAKNVHSPEGKSLGFFKSPILMFNSESPPDKVKKLSSSDLESSNLKIFGSGSTKQKMSISEASGSNSGFDQTQRKTEQMNINLEAGQEPWDIYYIIDDNQ